MRRGSVLAAILALAASACAPLTDEVFAPLALQSSSPVVVEESAGVVEIPLRLAAPREQALSVAYRLVPLDAQNDCQEPDFGAADGRVEWVAGSREAHVRVWIADDDLAERDERFEVRLEVPEDPSVSELGRVEVVIADDDRTALLDAQELGVTPDASEDQSAALQALLDRAAKLGRAVVVMAPGDYEMASVTLSAGTTLSAHGVRWHRPALSAADIVTLRLSHAGAEPSLRALVEGLTIDGRREEQGPYRDKERQQAHLVELGGDSEQGGAVRASLEKITLLSGTGSGLFVDSDSDVTVCGLSASELWRDALTLNGGATRLRVRNLDATATEGTGLWLGAHAPGFGGSYRIDVEAEDLSVAAGDVEIEVTDSSRVSLHRLTMTEAPIRVDAPGGTLRIEDSVLVLGAPAVRSPWAIAHDVELTRTTLIAAPSPDDVEPADFAAVSLTGQSFAFGPATPGRGHLGFTDCRWELSDGVVTGKPYAIENVDADTSVVVSGGTLGPGFSAWFGPKCLGCTLAP